MSIKRLNLVREDLGDCRRCGLCQTRKNIVFGVGDPDAALMFVGEGPGADEDEQGLPFVGAAGALLTKMIEAMGWTRDTVYIANIIKCRPTTEDGENRPGSPEEVAQCYPFLRKQIVAIRPLVVVAMGNLAMRTILGLDGESPGITRMRGQWQDREFVEIFCHPVKIMPTFHPSFLLRQPSGKRYVWKDLQDIGRVLAADGVRPPNSPWTRT
jgi:uracil-DNA glycosylase